MSVPPEFLKQIPYFVGLTDRELSRIRPLVHDRTYPRGEMVILEGESCEAIYFVKSGRVKVFKTSSEGREQVLRIMKAGDTFNEVPVFDGGPNPASVEALDSTSLYVLSATDLQSLMLELPAISRNVVRVLASRLRHLVELVEDLSFRHVTGRIAKILLQHVRDAAAGNGAGRLTQQQMATMAGTAREMVGRALKGLEQAGAIKMERGRIVIVDREILERLS
ncbi:MAG: Crp/Fnr family transcriptional regulator [Actinobacteria bacterium]|nr:Crp/Fnr family transcriptional regulator [Actinomycetota bacterium]